MLLSLFGDTLPFESIYADMCGDRRRDSEDETLAGLIEIATNLLEITELGVDQVLNIDAMPNSLYALQSQKSVLAGRHDDCGRQKR